MNALLEKAAASYRRIFRSEPEAVSWAPGRVEILGNHTDYNDGFVLSAALDLGIAAAAGRFSSPSSALEVWSSNCEGAVSRSRFEAPERLPGRWDAYPLGVIDRIRRSGVDTGSLRIAFESTLPLGAGLSSSAALELATAEAVYALAGSRPSEPMEVAKLCQRAEVEFVGVPCGILDQFSSLFGRRHHALFLDARTLDHERLPFGRDDIAIVVADSGVQHALVGGEYRRLREFCEACAARLGEVLGRPVAKLRDVSLSEFLDASGAVDEDIRRRGEHVLRENARVIGGRDALRGSDLERLGQLMLESHASSRDLFGNSCAELDFLIERAAGAPGFIGGKLSGGGFGGSTVNLVRAPAADAFARTLERAYEERFRRPLRAFVSPAGDGAFGARL